MNALNKLEWIGSYTGILAALLIAANIGLVFWRYVFVIISSVSLAILFKYKELEHAKNQQIVFTIINLIGLISWW